MVAVKKNATYADLEAVPDTMVAELIDGSLVAQPRPNPRHSAASSSLTIEVGGPYQKGRGGPGGWLFLDEPELHVGIQVLVPDIAGWCEPNKPKGEKAYIETCPDWVCEILSPSTANYDRGAKMRIYRDFGVTHYWLLDPEHEFLEVYEKQGEAYAQVMTFERGDNVRAIPFDEIEFPLMDLFPIVSGEIKT